MRRVLGVNNEWRMNDEWWMMNILHNKCLWMFISVVGTQTCKCWATQLVELVQKTDHFWWFRWSLWLFRFIILLHYDVTIIIPVVQPGSVQFNISLNGPDLSKLFWHSLHTLHGLHSSRVTQYVRVTQTHIVINSLCPVSVANLEDCISPTKVKF